VGGSTHDSSKFNTSTIGGFNSFVRSCSSVIRAHKGQRQIRFYWAFSEVTWISLQNLKTNSKTRLNKLKTKTGAAVLKRKNQHHFKADLNIVYNINKFYLVINYFYFCD
jgi:hypothetical protein